LLQIDGWFGSSLYIGLDYIILPEPSISRPFLNLLPLPYVENVLEASLNTASGRG
jgi:hypothetical protein